MTWKPSRLTREQMEERRRTGGRLLKAGKLSQTEIGRRLSVSQVAVSWWAKQLATGGMRGLRRRTSPGRPPKLTHSQQRELIRHLKRGALAAGFPTDRWTLWRVQRLIERLFGVTYHPNYLNRLLDKLDWSVQQPLPRAIEQDAEEVRAWREKDWPRIKKGPPQRCEHRIFRRIWRFVPGSARPHLGTERQAPHPAPCQFGPTGLDDGGGPDHLGQDLQTPFRWRDG
jgi:transposase